MKCGLLSMHEVRPKATNSSTDWVVHVSLLSVCGLVCRHTGQAAIHASAPRLRNG